MIDVDYPHEIDFNDDSQKEGTRKEYKRDLDLFRMLPSEDRKKGDNRLFFLPFNLNRFAFFQGWPDMGNFYAKIAVHWVEQADENGNVRRVMVLCERKMNEYAKGLSQANKPVPAVFEDTVCAFCNRSQLYWDDYRDLRKEAGIENLSKDEFKDTMAKHPNVQKARNLAKEWQANDRFYFAVYDVDKAEGKKDLDPGEDTVRIQGYFGPDSIMSQLYRKFKNKNRFFDFNSNSYRVVNVTRDNTRSAQFCEYLLDTEGEMPDVPAEVLTYLRESEDIPDPAQWVQIWTPEQKQAYVDNFGGGAPTKAGAKAPAPRPAVAKPTIAPPAAPAPALRQAPQIPTRPAAPTAPAAPSTETSAPKRPRASWR